MARMISTTLEIRKCFVKEMASWALNDTQDSVGWLVVVCGLGRRASQGSWGGGSVSKEQPSAK